VPGGLTRVDLAAGLHALGLRSGDRVVVHASLRSLGPVAGGSETVVDALLDTIGATGLLAVPTFTYDNVTFTGQEPGRTGAISEAVRRRSDAVRSCHPTYSVAAVGSGADDLLRGHELYAATDVDTPLDRLASSGGLILLLGVGHTSNTTIHVAEFRAQVPYLDIVFDPDWPRRHMIAASGNPPLEVEYDRFPGCSRAFAVVERGLRARSAIRDGRVGSAIAQLVRGDGLIAEAVRLLERDPAALLCTDPDCYRCSRARTRLIRREASLGREAGADHDG
jgi:aminoglycoside 3-N-acetyltransferase